MNIFFLSEYYSQFTIDELRKNVNYQSVGVGDILICVDGIRIIMVICNTDDIKGRIPLTFPMIAQLISRDEELAGVKPILYLWDMIGERTGQLPVLEKFRSLFQDQELAFNIINEAINQLSGHVWRQNAKLIKDALLIDNKVPDIEADQAEKNYMFGDVGKGDKLLIVENYFEDKLKNEYYDLRALGCSERESLVKVRNRHPEVLSYILRRFYGDNKGRNLYYKISVNPTNK